MTQPHQQGERFPTWLKMGIAGAICLIVGMVIAVSFTMAERGSQEREIESLEREVSDLQKQIADKDRQVVAQSARESERSLTFADRTWLFAGPCSSTGSINRPSMSAVYYTTDDSNLRLIELIPNESSLLSERVFARILQVQINHDGRWISHGARFESLLNGKRSESHYVFGEVHGTFREWYANGQLHVEREYAGGIEHGRGRGWYESGQPMYDDIYVDGEEVQGKAWNRDGTLMP